MAWKGRLKKRFGVFQTASDIKNRKPSRDGMRRGRFLCGRCGCAEAALSDGLISSPARRAVCPVPRPGC
ncbi:hypothetical protein HMPREF9123_2901 [Neisseria bacilliformis ATCC BAA-1200]|uniref:Uncharacterized protein n=1 Tax=Neisseria bacilliformis ATCC BAA-1200 TaxID=888742 RepID=F2BGP4_9NEIS|nr:hypothetical protein HMPREF9123_2901 [Neisseria bacilliformis ATCC BAA-1200]